MYMYMTLQEPSGHGIGSGRASCRRPNAAKWVLTGPHCTSLQLSLHTCTSHAHNRVRELIIDLVTEARGGRGWPS